MRIGKRTAPALTLLAGLLLSGGTQAHDNSARAIETEDEESSELEVGITDSVGEVEVTHDDEKVTIRREQDTENTVDDRYALTSRECPPFCIQPASLHPDVETIGELEVLDYLRRRSEGDDSILVVDSRTQDWVERGTIPGSENIPWTDLSQSQGADPFTIHDIMTGQFGAEEQEGLWDFSDAKTLVLFCNGPWCGQSPANIRTLLRYGYPADRIKWYRGGMQNWENLGLTTVQDD
ncbi:MAG: rhodanese-like domain-containing protein [Thiohalospira sp.]|uniref:rhodanese-like domain-containing protein n=1 Tax=Thiohalospira sp. TaxID=3080549 RepID=UPI0039816052